MMAVMKTRTLQAVLKRIGTGLTMLRIRKGYSNITDFANDHNLPLIQYWRIEKGKANITIKSLMKLLAIHQLAPEDFFCLLRDKQL
jgi:hypothetical protein